MKMYENEPNRNRNKDNILTFFVKFVSIITFSKKLPNLKPRTSLAKSNIYPFFAIYNGNVMRCTILIVIIIPANSQNLQHYEENKSYIK